jgi:hypothetical protein
VAISNFLVQINFPGSLLASEVKGQPLDDRILKQTDIKYCEITFRFEIDTGAGKTDRSAEGYWTLHLWGLNNELEKNVKEVTVT